MASGMAQQLGFARMPPEPGVGDHEVARRAECLLDGAGDVRVERGEHDGDARGNQGRVAGLHDAAGEVRGALAAEPPRRGLGVGQARGPLRGGQEGDLKPGVLLKELQHSLPHHSRSA
jgi:hypothetical protein